jgi:hypothetical protein
MDLNRMSYGHGVATAGANLRGLRLLALLLSRSPVEGAA